MKISLIQIASPETESIAGRRERVAAMVAAAAGADLVLLPELWGPGYFAFDCYEKAAEPLHGDTVEAAKEWAARLGCFLHLGSFVERTPEGTLHNTAVLLGPMGEIVHTYRKIHVFGYRSREKGLLTPGNDVSVVSTALGALSATTCYDLRFPELWRSMVDRGAESVLVPAAWPAARREHWRLFTSCRAVEEQLLMYACNAVGTQAGVELGGYSRVVDPWGKVLVEADDAEGITSCEVDLGVVAAARAEFPVLNDRRLA
jgi:predicted amidohydrolase